MPACTFFGHRDCPGSIRPKLYQTILRLIEENHVDRFYVGHQGAFDRYALAALKQAAAQYPHIRYDVVLAYLPVHDDDTLPQAHTLFPTGIEHTPRRFAICYRNRWMVERSDYVVTYVLYRGGASQFAELAQRKGKTMISIT